MNKILIKWTLIVLLIAFAIMAFTGLSFVFGVQSPFLGELHEITGVIFLTAIVVHVITLRKVLHSFMCPVKQQK